MFSPLSPRDTRSEANFQQAVEHQDIEHAVKQWTDPNWHLNRLPKLSESPPSEFQGKG